MTLRRRGEVVGARAPLGEPTRANPFPRAPDGTINNCALANREPEKDCQMCRGRCPDREKFAAEVLSMFGNGRMHEQADADQAAYHDEMERREQRAGEDAFAQAAGDEGRVVEVTWGEERFQPGPLKFNPMGNGPFSASTIVRRGETIGQATLRVYREIAAVAQVIHEEKVAAYLKNLAQLASDAGKVEVP